MVTFVPARCRSRFFISRKSRETVESPQVSNSEVLHLLIELGIHIRPSHQENRFHLNYQKNLFMCRFSMFVL